MSLNIKNEHVHELAREVARRTGQSQTSAVEEALGRRLAELRASESQEHRRAEVLSLLADIQLRLAGVDAAEFTTDDLYDENGLPA